MLYKLYLCLEISNMVISVHLLTEHYRTLQTPISFGDRYFAAAKLRLWKTLPSTLQQMTSYEQFRRHLKAHLFRA